MLAPGRPGEPNRTVTAGPGTPARATAADITYVQMMTLHHRQAIEMAALAPAQARDARLKSLAERIDKGQAGEISMMQSWLRRHGAAEQGADGHSGHASGPGRSAGPASGSMPGMATPAQLAELRAATGAGFDRLFLRLMITHHQGALTMAREVLANGSDITVSDMAREVLATQNAEINRMRDLTAGLS